MAEAARAAGSGAARLASFAYRLTAPLFDHQGMLVSAAREQDPLVTAVRNASGRLTATGAHRPA